MERTKAEQIASNRNALAPVLLKGRSYTAENGWNDKSGWSVVTWKNGLPLHIEHD